MKPSSISNRRDFLRQVGLGSLSLGLTTVFQQCKGDSDAVKPFNPYTFMTNPKDPIILKVNTQQGELIEYFGTRDAQGVPKSIDVISYRSSVKNDTSTDCYFDSQSNLSKVIADDGSQFSFQWTNSTQCTLTFVSGDRVNQLNTAIDFAKLPVTGGRIGTLHAPTESMTQARGGQSIQMYLPTLSADEQQDALPASMARLAANTSVTIDVKKCGFPADADVWVRLYKYDKLNNLVKVGRYPTVRVTKGMYASYVLPDVAEKLEINPQQLCQWAIQKGVCKAGATVVSEGLCLALTGVAASASGGTAAILALAVCKKWVSKALTKAVEYGCGKVIDNTGATQKVAEFCDATFENVDYTIWSGNLLFIAEAVGQGEKPIYAKGIEIDGKAAYPKLLLDLGGAATVNSLTLTPAKPLARQSYTARAVLNCLPFGTRVTVSVVGTDSYNDTVSTTVGALLSDGTFVISLLVPGAIAGVNDAITLTAVLPDGKQLKQSASLVFG